MTFKFDEIKTITTVSKRALQQQKNHIDTKAALREKPCKPKKTGRNGESTRRNDTQGAPHLGARPWDVSQWSTPTGKMPGGWLAERSEERRVGKVRRSPRSATLHDV